MFDDDETDTQLDQIMRTLFNDPLMNQAREDLGDIIIELHSRGNHELAGIFMDLSARGTKMYEEARQQLASVLQDPFSSLQADMTTIQFAAMDWVHDNAQTNLELAETAPDLALQLYIKSLHGQMAQISSVRDLLETMPLDDDEFGY